MKNVLIALFYGLMLLPCAHSAEVTDVPEGCMGTPCAYFNGEIKSGDLIKLKSAFNSPMRRRIFVDALGQEAFTLSLNSLGGNLEEAMEIGRWIRKEKISTTMAMNSECFSACVYILAAGVTKQIYYEMWRNKVGIHRPYLARTPKESVQVAMRKALADSKAYFLEMNIPEQLADAMFSISPNEVEILTDDKLSFYRLSGLDIVFEEESELKAAALYGMTRQKYMQNKKRFHDEVNTACVHLGGDEGSKCVEGMAKKYGLHRSQMKQRK